MTIFPILRLLQYCGLWELRLRDVRGTIVIVVRSIQCKISTDLSLFIGSGSLVYPLALNLFFRAYIYVTDRCISRFIFLSSYFFYEIVSVSVIDRSKTGHLQGVAVRRQSCRRPGNQATPETKRRIPFPSRNATSPNTKHHDDE